MAATSPTPSSAATAAKQELLELAPPGIVYCLPMAPLCDVVADLTGKEVNQRRQRYDQSFQWIAM